MSARGELRLVDSRTGEVVDECPTCSEWARKYRGVLSQLGQMRMELEGEFRNHDLFPRAKRLHDYWRSCCNHPNVTFGVDELKQALPRLKEHDDAMVRRAIDGARYDCFTTIRKNGTVLRHDSWELIMRKSKFLEFCNKAPYHLPSPEAIKTLAEALVWVWGWEIERAVAEARRRLR